MNRAENMNWVAKTRQLALIIYVVDIGDGQELLINI